MSKQRAFWYLVTIAWFLIIAIAVNADETATNDTTLDWFALGTYLKQDSSIGLSFDFHYYEDNSPDSYLGTMNFAWDCDGEHAYLDEIVDITPYTDEYTGETITADEIWEGMSEYHDPIILTLNGQDDAFFTTPPQGFDIDANAIVWESYQTSGKCLNDHIVFLPIVSK